MTPTRNSIVSSTGRQRKGKGVEGAKEWVRKEYRKEEGKGRNMKRVRLGNCKNEEDRREMGEEGVNGKRREEKEVARRERTDVC